MAYLFQKSTRFANLTSLTAGFVIILLFVLVIYGIIIYQPLIPGSSKDEDLRNHRRIVERIHGGEGYYTAAGEELRARGYATRSVFNWRLPLLVWLLGHLPGTDTGQVIAVILACISLLIWIGALQQNQLSFGELVLGSLALLEPIIYSLSPGVFLAHEFWAGTLITLSLAAYARDWRVISVISGLMALFLRELTLPFTCVMLVLSYIEGRRFEALFWSIGMVAFGGELFFHWSIVKNLMTEADSSLMGGWVVFGGWQFVLSTAQMHPYLLLAPHWVTAIILPLVLLGLAGWRGQLGSRVAATVGIYILAYLFVGLPYNQYWGLMYTNVMLLGLLYAPYSLRDLWQSVRRNLIKGTSLEKRV